jgi:hypothetical protein
MPRDYKVYLDDILQATTKIRQCTAGLAPAVPEGHPIAARSESVPHRGCRAKC